MSRPSALLLPLLLLSVMAYAEHAELKRSGKQTRAVAGPDLGWVCQAGTVAVQTSSSWRKMAGASCLCGLLGV